MRALFKTMMTSSFIAAAALTVAACGGAEEAEVEPVATDVETVDPMLDGTTNDVTAVDGATGMDANMAMDSNMTMDANMTDANMMGDNMMMNNGM